MHVKLKELFFLKGHKMHSVHIIMCLDKFRIVSVRPFVFNFIFTFVQYMLFSGV